MRIEPAAAVVGHIGVPGDRAISHRALLLAAVGNGETRIEGFGRSRETETTLAAVRQLGAEVEEEEVDALVVRGAGLRGLRADAPVDCGSAATLLTLLLGLLAGQADGEFVVSGDESLRRRSVNPPADELRTMGGRIEAQEGRPPVRVAATELRPGGHTLRTPSADVKSALLFAGMLARGGPTTVTEAVRTADHTETLLAASGVGVGRSGRATTVRPAEHVRLSRVEVPGDISAAAPFIAAASLIPGSHLTVHDVGLNALRSGLVEVLVRMGARITVFNRRRVGGEPAGDLEVIAAPLTATTVRRAEVPRMLDELGLFGLAAGMARGESIVGGVDRLPEAERNWIETATVVLRGLGVRVSASEDGFRGKGVPTRPKGGGVVSAVGDPRIAMLAAVAGLASREGVTLEDPDSVAVSFPGFFDLLESVTQR